MSSRVGGTASDEIREAIAALPSAAFAASELVARLPDVSRELFDQVLSRMVQDGKIERLQRGFYLRGDEAAEVVKKDVVVQPAATTTPIATSAAAPKIANLIWTTADEVLRGDYKPHEYGSVILPFTVMRRIDCVLAPTKVRVLEAVEKHRASTIDPAIFYTKAADGLKFWNTSKYDFATLANDAAGLTKNMLDYIGGFSDSIRDIFDYYKAADLIADLARKNLLLLLVQKFARVELHPDVVSNADMGQAFEELIRRFSEQSNETAGEHYTPRDAIRLAVELLFASDEDSTLSKNQRIVKLYDPTAGTGGMLSVAEEHLKQFNSGVVVRPYGQELNEETYAICKADMLIKGQDVSKIVLGNTLSADAFANEKFDYMLSNPPYGVDWKKVKSDVESEAKRLGFKGRFGPGLPRISDGQMLFLLHLISKMHLKGSAETSRVAIVMNGSPLFSGGAGSGESEIRRFVLENDLLEAIVGLPTDMFYNTGIATYVWILSNNKERRRENLVQLIDATRSFGKMRRSLGSKRRELRSDDITQIVANYSAFEETEFSKILPIKAFGYRTIVIERPLRLNFQINSLRLARITNDSTVVKNGVDLKGLLIALTEIGSELFTSRPKFIQAMNAAFKKHGLSIPTALHKAIVNALSERDDTADICLDSKTNKEPAPELRDTENVPLEEDVNNYFEREIKRFVPDAWIDHDKTRIGYDIAFTRYFYKCTLPRSLKNIDADLAAITREIGDYNRQDGCGIVELHLLPLNGKQLIPVKYVATCNDSVMPESTPPDTSIEYVDIGSVQAGIGITTREAIVFSDAPSRARRIVRRGDVIVSTVRTYLRAIASIDKTSEDVIVSTGFAVIRPGSHLQPQFFRYAMQSSVFIEEIVARSYGVSYPAIAANDLIRIPINVPSLHEQSSIAEFLDRETATADALVEKHERLIELLKERRAAVITDAVTGRIDVNTYQSTPKAEVV